VTTENTNEKYQGAQVSHWNLNLSATAEQIEELFVHALAHMVAVDK
jgi:hypothetical protein